VILVDTNVWSEAAKPNGTRKVVQWTEQNRNDLWLSTIVIAESGVKRAGLEQWLQRLEFLNAARTLPFDSLAAYALGQLLAAKPQQKNMLDTMLAAQALSRDCVIATRNTRDFEWTGVKLVNPWEV
jgi:predicted nucleic acid-binding protein